MSFSHTRKEIIVNQTKFREEIVAFLKKEFREMKKEIRNINSKDPEIVNGKVSLVKKTEQIKIREEINKLFLNWKNLYPSHYAWWDEDNQEVIKIKYIDEAGKT